ncbi:hypothetical protein C3747_9g88 [Trypanosoma cruzi]|uniref:Uncharacterized protein n=2 Tax=Trypanosoma cruzi TaxID=5693 RepID=Q4DQD1_TRYCC|nr:hypothetical protein, conserved [Trypanosoma cruzi]EAN94735.1 hypothetical protein, conserved [Trypanosoma cruzi]KAF8298471.1 hypothetical protein TcYC6_0074100 [Trypanosoma cruzi]PWV19625.1 hypothetical protein C3747_9g88 [Trypanosoma cruzi]RNC48716.1 hypothetical protein TcCL_NonESM01376 [Trypanosoma cruzi]|eukprot:XP_816586.1 hypothetical protein [Trypanosoma cruzi strain CL Brener]
MWTQQLSLQKPNAQQTPEEKRKQALVTANVFIENNRGLVRKAMDQYQSVAGSNYWTYGYMGGAMVTTMAACLSIGGRVPFFRNYASWISLAGGYFGGKAMLGMHNSYNLASVVNVINKSIDETRKMDEQHGFSIPEYAREVDSLKRMKYELIPYSTEAIEARKHDVKNMSLNESADALVEAYEKRKQASAQRK